MEYLEITLEMTGLDYTIRDVLPYWLETLGFEGFQENEDTLVAYIAADRFDRAATQGMLRLNRVPDDRICERLIPDRNWNEDWEDYFEPVVIDHYCLIRAPFHSTHAHCPIEIIIEPKMSFGTGHHATTSLMVSEMLKTDLVGKTLLDAGCGTGILAILAEKLGCRHIMALDVDGWSFRNATENMRINQCTKIDLTLGDAAAFSVDHPFDYIMANINLDILKAGSANFSRLLKPGGELVISGIRDSDIDTFSITAAQSGLEYRYSRISDNWALVRYKKI